MNELAGLTAGEQIRRIEAGDVSPEECFAYWAERAGADELNAYLWRAESPAERAPANGKPLAGVPIAAKDIFCTEGIPTTAGSRILEGFEPTYTATAVERLAEAAAPLLGKTNCDEFAMGSSNENSAYGPVLNPWDRARVPGGSSGGSAAAVAGGLAPWAIGTDTGGSIRQPASLCGIVGLKPTYGAVSRYGMVAFASSLDQCGPLTRDVTDAALLLRTLAGRDPCDSTSTGIPGGIEVPSREDLRGLRFGVPRELSRDVEGMEAGVIETFDAAVRLVEELGGNVDDCELPHSAHALEAYYVLAPAEASSNLARYDGVRYGLRVGGDGDLIGMYERTRAAGFGAEVKRRIMLGTYGLSAGYYEAYYGQAQRVRTKLSEDFATAFERFDYLLTPTSPTVAFELGSRTERPLAMYLSDYCTVPMSLAGIPAISIPAGLAEPEGGGPKLPVGLQLCAPAFGENGLLDAAHAIERAIGFGKQLPAASSASRPGAAGSAEG